MPTSVYRHDVDASTMSTNHTLSDALIYADVPIIEKRTGNASFPVRMPALLDDYDGLYFNDWGEY